MCGQVQVAQILSPPWLPGTGRVAALGARPDYQQQPERVAQPITRQPGTGLLDGLASQPETEHSRRQAKDSLQAEQVGDVVLGEHVAHQTDVQPAAVCLLWTAGTGSGVVDHIP